MRNARALRHLLCTTVLSFVSHALAREVPVTDVAGLQAAIGVAEPGDVIVLANGTYDAGNITCARPGTTALPITVRSATARGAHIRFSGLEGFKVQAAHWHFEGLWITGVCSTDDACEHAFHVTGAADGFVLRGSKVEDFNAQLKVNAAQIDGSWRTPSSGLIEGNDLGDTRPRVTSSPVTKLNIDTGDEWVVRANILNDFHKDGGNGISYGAFMKSGGQRGLFERNLVLCTRDVATGGTRIGLSFGGGGTAPQFCAPAFDGATPCSVEHRDGIMRNNIIAGCSDVGIYLNRAANSSILHNTLFATTGVDFRFDTTTGEARGNLLESRIRARDNATFIASDNVENQAPSAFAGWYTSPLTGDLRIAGDVSTLVATVPENVLVGDDYCARVRPAGARSVGAVEHSLGSCDTLVPVTATPSVDGGQPAADSGTPSDAAFPVDASGHDAGPTADAASSIDAYSPSADAGSSVDGGVRTDAGAAVDASANAHEPDEPSCGCEAAAMTEASAMHLLVVCGLVLVGARRRRAFR